MAIMFRGFGIATGFAAASILAVVGSAPAAAQLGWDQSTAPVKYLEYDLPYYKLPLDSPHGIYVFPARTPTSLRALQGAVQLCATQCRKLAANEWGGHSVHRLRPNTVLEDLVSGISGKK